MVLQHKAGIVDLAVLTTTAYPKTGIIDVIARTLNTFEDKFTLQICIVVPKVGILASFRKYGMFSVILPSSSTGGPGFQVSCLDLVPFDGNNK